VAIVAEGIEKRAIRASGISYTHFNALGLFGEDLNDVKGFKIQQFGITGRFGKDYWHASR
jgi:hypothetical protein